MSEQCDRCGQQFIGRSEFNKSGPSTGPLFLVEFTREISDNRSGLAKALFARQRPTTRRDWKHLCTGCKEYGLAEGGHVTETFYSQSQYDSYWARRRGL
jgi:hypothetical protein